MKKQSLLVLFLLVLKAGIAFSESPTFNVYITNETYPTPNTFRFDIWIKKTGAGTLELANLQLILNVNPAFRDSGKITVNMVKGSSMFEAMQIPSRPGQLMYLEKGQGEFDKVNIGARMNPGCGFGTIIPDTGSSCNAMGLRFITVELTTTMKSWPAGVKPNLDFNFKTSPKASSMLTKVSYYPQPCPSTGKDATPQGTFYDSNSEKVICTENLAAPATW